MLEGLMRDAAVFEGGRGLGVEVGELTPIMPPPLPKTTHMYYGVGDGWRRGRGRIWRSEAVTNKGDWGGEHHCSQMRESVPKAIRGQNGAISEAIQGHPRPSGAKLGHAPKYFRGQPSFCAFDFFGGELISIPPFQRFQVSFRAC